MTTYIETYADYRRELDRLEKIIGKRGITAVAKLPADASMGDIDAAAVPRRLKGRTVAAARAAGRTAHTLGSVWERCRRELAKARRNRVSAGEAYRHDRNLRRMGLKLMFPWRPRQTACRNAAQLARVLDARRRDALIREMSPQANGATEVEWVDTLENCGVAITSEQDWDGYSSRCRYPKTIHTITVRAVRMLESDMPGGRRVTDAGLVTLGAEGVPSPDGTIQLYKAVWARKTRGIDYDTERGYIAVDGAEVAHGRTERDAVATLRRRRTMAQRAALSRCGVRREDALREHGNEKLNFRLARRAGLCAAGIKAWANKHFPELDPLRDTVTVAEALTTGDSQNLVMRAVALAVRRAG